MNCDNCGEDLQQGWICCPTCGYCSANNLQTTGVGITFNLSSGYLEGKEAIEKMIEQLNAEDWTITHQDPDRVAAFECLLDKLVSNGIYPSDKDDTYGSIAP